MERKTEPEQYVSGNSANGIQDQNESQGQNVREHLQVVVKKKKVTKETVVRDGKKNQNKTKTRTSRMTSIQQHWMLQRAAMSILLKPTSNF